MTKQRIHVETLRIRMPRDAARTPADARAAASEAGRRILQDLARAVEGHTGTVRIDDVTSGAVERVGADVKRKLG